MMSVLGACLAGGLLLVRRALRPVHISDRLARYGVTSARTRESLHGRLHRMVRERSRLEEVDIALCGSSADAIAARRILFALAAGTVPLAVWLMTSVAGSGVEGTWTLLLSFVLVPVGYVIPAIQVRNEARVERRRFRTSLSAYLDLVSIMLAGGAGIETALHSAARVGDGPTFDAISDALDLARTSRMSPWDTLAETGRRIGVNELPELAATVRLGGEHGARMTASLVAKASSLRSRELAEVEARANEATEKMGLPMVLLFLGFLVLLGYPAMQLITSGFAG